MNTLPLADVVSRGTPVSWYEGVAITQALCDALSRREGALAPDLGWLHITQDGRLEIPDDRGQGQPPVQGAGRVLLALVPEHEMPVQLRLLALTAVSPSPSYASASELSAALDYFARPDRTAQVRAVYERCLALPAPASEPAAMPELLSPPLAGKREEKEAVRRPRRPWGLAVAGLLVTITAAAAGAAWLTGAWRPGGQPMPAPAGGIASAVSGTAAKVGGLAAGAVDAVGRGLGLGGESSPVAGGGQDISLPAPQVGRGRAARTAPPEMLADLPTVRWAGIAAGIRVDETVRATFGEATPEAKTASPESPLPYYTAADEGVAPPALLRPRLPQLPPTGVRLTELPHVDLLVSESGEVEWVRLWPADVGVHSAMMLSAIKNWRFEPARIGGRAVRYRQTIALTSR